MWVGILVAVVALVIVYLYRVATRKYGQLEAMGIPVIPPFLCFGSGPFWFHKVDAQRMYLEETEKYSKTKIWGKYEGATPIVYTVDTELIKELFVKRFDSFLDRVVFPVEDDYRTIDVTHGEPWKYLRKSFTPVFTTGKLKIMVDPIHLVLDKAMAHLKHKSSGGACAIDAVQFFRATALEVILKVAFGVEGNFIEKEKVNTDTKLYKSMTDAFLSFISTSYVDDCFWTLFSMYPSMVKYTIGSYMATMQRTKKMTLSILDKREKEGVVHNDDFIGKLLEVVKEVRAAGGKLHGVNEEMALSNGGIFLLAGFNTTANSLSSLVYMLAKHPDVQQRLYEEICENVNSAADVTYESVSKFSYMESCIAENLRLHPPVTLNNRLCTSDVEVNGMLFKKGTQINIPIYSLNRMKEYFGEDSDEFNPERFHSGQVSMNQPSFHSFGFGPRACIGMRFSLIEMKIILGRLLYDYEILEEPDFVWKFLNGSLFMLEFDEVRVKFKRRH